jgi:tellurite methyltransferase
MYLNVTAFKIKPSTTKQMKQSYINKFNAVYGSNDCYYGLDLRHEFTDYFAKCDLTSKHALDMGCGEGRYSLFLARHGCHVTAIDRSAVGIEKLQHMSEKHRLPILPILTDIAEFDFPGNNDDGLYDIIVAATVLDHLNDELRNRTVFNIKKALKRSGILYVNVFTRSDPGYNLMQNDSATSDSTDISDTAECMAHYFDHDELKSLFNDFEHLNYYEGVEPDLSHGRPHHHGWACLLARKPA